VDLKKFHGGQLFSVITRTRLVNASFSTTMKLHGGLTAEASESAAGTLANAFEPRPDKQRTGASETVEK
jgi:hypothetical protein